MKEQTEKNVVLLDFAKKEEKNTGSFFQTIILKKGKLIGNYKGFSVWYYEIPVEESKFAKLPLKKQRKIIFKILKSAKKKKCVAWGVSMLWQSFFEENFKLKFISGEGLALEKALQRLATITKGFYQKKILICGVDNTAAKRAADFLLAKGAEIMLCGKKAESLAKWYYEKEGLAVPVFKTEKAAEVAEGILCLAGENFSKHREKIVIVHDVSVKIAEDGGKWNKPFSDRGFSCGLAAALFSVENTLWDNENKHQKSGF